ncbi:hypothetical protein CACET_c27590 [Clostridium aceticum]|uniref:Uncharacterized protein n=1 Tax=Clostridium aceticum TaxID=84022 RepID=A0A0D8I988_9CLOT|nr:hypothetical protein [Clostridium aceticum]AKL96204.1 hypothetical protein CACET_c27590 [Clostridium aceticum]KJF26619.1 hypothetical protein TZ02_12155 [Clostridium aceticum]
MLNKKKIAIAATGIVIMICGVLVYVNFINKEPAYDYTSVPETTITEQHQEYSQDKDVYFEPDSEPVFIAEPVIDWEEPPVVTVYNPDADLNDDGHVDKGEWEQWIAENPADLNQDLYITAEEQAEFNGIKEPVTNEKPAEVKEDTIVGNTKPPVDNTPPTNNNNNQGNTKPADKPTPPATNNNGMTQKEIDNSKQMSEDAINDILNWDSGTGGNGSLEEYQKPFDPVN